MSASKSKKLRKQLRFVAEQKMVYNWKKIYKRMRRKIRIAYVFAIVSLIADFLVVAYFIIRHYM